MAIVITVETPLQDDVRAMVEELNAHLNPLSPPEFQFQMTAEQMAEPHTTVFVARSREGVATGMGSLKVHDARLAEVKRMWTRPAWRGGGVGRLLLQAVEALAREKGIHRLALETGGTDGFTATWRFYEAGGFRRCSAFLDYPDTEYSRFYEKLLIEEKAA
ncbi:GNAT family N-acetyltransferase [Chelativorans salis]|uniref:GNAT family N-acetyltransferase n=1 Tax=Chelativorans salis TaxID=2978478 RepID=A0ABT2LM48_9HYPH|nr:GNAT family N-acetyltransferase [Chelativorans sp. EGI FJ00035]MCT7375667.1 GNAT family N-acetyltransferase [Chelativorans sp. EGI FJ00035]